MSLTRNLAGAGFILAALAAPLAQAAGTVAGTDITNIATVTFTDPNNNTGSEASNPSTFKVAEILDVTVTANNAGNAAVTSPESDAVLSFTVTNTGNGQETYALAAANALAGDQFDPANVRIYIDNGDGNFDPATDTLLDPGVNDPSLAPDGSVTVFVVSDIPGALADGNLGNVRISAESVTAQGTVGSDAAGTVFAGQGTGGVDAVVGSTQAEASVTNGYIVRQFALDLTKSHAITHPTLGNGKPVPGATITYTLTLVANGGGTFNNIVITDNIPAGTTYVPGSLTLNAAALTDAQNGDAGYVQGSVIRVYPNGSDNVATSGTVTAPATNVVTFKVTIN